MNLNDYCDHHRQHYLLFTVPSASLGRVHCCNVRNTCHDWFVCLFACLLVYLSFEAILWPYIVFFNNYYNWYCRSNKITSTCPSFLAFVCKSNLVTFVVFGDLVALSTFLVISSPSSSSASPLSIFISLLSLNWWQFDNVVSLAHAAGTSNTTSANNNYCRYTFRCLLKANE